MARPNLRPRDVHRVFSDAGASVLHHANTVTTSATFLENGALLSRAYVERHGLQQTPQVSDDKDRQFHVWNCIFLDHVDIHHQGGRVRGPNRYGPVLFKFDIGLLLRLPEGSTVNVTKSNPVHWVAGQRVSERWFRKPRDLKVALSFGDFDKMIVIRPPGGRLNFPGRCAVVEIDDPRRKLGSRDPYYRTERKLRSAALVGEVCASFSRHDCKADCSCEEKYRSFSSSDFRRFFE